MPTSPTPADRPADLLRAAADRAREAGHPLHTELGNWLEATAHRLDASTHPDWQWAVVEPSALAVARQLLGASVAAPPAPADQAACLHIAADTVEALPVPDTSPGRALGAAWALGQIRRLADDAAAGVQPPGGFTTRVCRNCSRTITWVPDGTWTHEPHNPDGGHIAAPYTLPAECHASAAPAAPEEPTR